MLFVRLPGTTWKASQGLSPSMISTVNTTSTFGLGWIKADSSTWFRICMKRTLCHKFKQAMNGIAESEKAFDRLDEAAPANLKTKEWLASERIAQSNRINDPAAMDVYEINIKKDELTSSASHSEFMFPSALSKKEIELRLLNEGISPRLLIHGQTPPSSL
jgi:hypothetical protein